MSVLDEQASGWAADPFFDLLVGAGRLAARVEDALDTVVDGVPDEDPLAIDLLLGAWCLSGRVRGLTEAAAAPIDPPTGERPPATPVLR